MIMTDTPAQRIALVLRGRGVEVPPSDVETWLACRFDQYVTVRPLADFGVFCENAASEIEDGTATWLGALVSRFGGTL